MRPVRDPSAAACRVTLEPDRHDELHAELDDWRENVGAPVAVDCGHDAAPQLLGIDVLSWNIAIGRARFDEVLDRLRDGDWGGAAMSAQRPLVILIQEAFRADESVPDALGTRHHGGRLQPRSSRDNIVDLALRNGLSLRYSPSMRNGAHPSDRGNAILSTARLEGAHGVLLPYVRQRRVAVMAQLAGHPELAFVSAHLDTHGQPRREASRFTFAPGRTVQAAALAARLRDRPGSVVLGADLNTVFGVSDPAVRALVDAGMHPARRVGNWRHTFHARLKLLLDHVLYRSEDRRIAHAEVHRIDEAPGDRSSGVFGSDHHPLLARIELAGT
jgi:endonuclease/exonuclease/phosphatase family metal-dependent hydrolase